MAHVGQELALGSVGRFGHDVGFLKGLVGTLHRFSELLQLLFGPLSLGDVFGDANDSNDDAPLV